MDEDRACTSFLPKSPSNSNPIEFTANTTPETIFSDTIAIFVESEWSNYEEKIFNEKNCSTQHGQVQLCSAIYAPSPQHIPQVVKHIYTRLAFAATEIDQGVPELLLSLCGSRNFLNLEDTKNLTKGLSKILTRCGFWAITSGEKNDSLANAIVSALHSTLPQRESNEETLVIVVNSSNVAYSKHLNCVDNSPVVSMTDSRYNTFYIVWNKINSTEQDILNFRSCTAINLANPPPALLVGVPSVAGFVKNAGFCTSSFDKQRSISVPSTPMGTTDKTIFLPNNVSTDVEKIPLPIALFCGTHLISLSEVDNYLQCGVPVLIVQDSSELCTLLKSCFVLYQNAKFNHSQFMEWIDAELKRILLFSNGKINVENETDLDALEDELKSAKLTICRILSSALDGDCHLVAFISTQNFENIAYHLLDLLMQTVADNTSLIRVLKLAVKLNVVSVVNNLKLTSVLTQEDQFQNLLLESLKTDDRIDVLSALLDQNIPIRITSALLLNWLKFTSDKYFFNTIILGHFLGFTYKLNKITESTANQINQLLQQLSGGIRCLFPVDCFNQTSVRLNLKGFNNGKQIQVLAIWALLLNRIELVKVLCAYSYEPMAFYLVLAKISRNLARKSREWFFYEQKFLDLSSYCNNTAVHLLNSVYIENTELAYRALCHRPNLAVAICNGNCLSLEKSLDNGHKNVCSCSTRRLTLAELAFEMNSREFIAHDCCQRFTLRLLYGNLQIRKITALNFVPNWFKIIISALFVVPISFWITTRSTTFKYNFYHTKNEFIDSDDDVVSRLSYSSSKRRPLSPTVALLENGRQIKNIRANSVYSIHSTKSNYLTDNNLTNNDFNLAVNLQDNCNVYPNNIDNTDSTLQTPDYLSNINKKNSLSSIPQNRQQTILQRTSSSGSEVGLATNRSAVSVGFQKKIRKKSSKKSIKSLNKIDKLREKKLYSNFFNEKPQRIKPINKNSNFNADFFMFYSTPITKYWLSLVFRMLYLIIFAYSVALPSCDFLSIDFFVWIWSFLWLIETVWIFNVRLQNCPWKEMSWSIFDIICTSSFLLFLLIARFSGLYFSNFNYVAKFIGYWYNVKAIWSLFLLYECYKTLIIYMPLSDVLGPLLIRIKLMITRDFVNFLILVIPIILSALAIKSTLYPDKEASSSTISSSVSWSFSQLFQTDLNILNQSEECKRSRLSSSTINAIQNWCANNYDNRIVFDKKAIGGYSNPKCAVQSWSSYFSVIQYFIILKLISWPILFALFARTAKRIDEEAERIWKYQLYLLATNFSIRPCLPPPLTPIIFIIVSCCQMTGCISNFFDRCLNSSSDHPDVQNGYGTETFVIPSQSTYSTIYRNPSVPSSKIKIRNIYWRQLSIDIWKKLIKKNDVTTKKATHPIIVEKLDLLFLVNNFYRKSNSNVISLLSSTAGKTTSSLTTSPTISQQQFKTTKKSQNPILSNNETSLKFDTFAYENKKKCRRIKIDQKSRNWYNLMPNYCPLKYSKSIKEFPIELQKFVQDYSVQNLIEIKKYWRQRRLSDIFCTLSKKNNVSNSIILSGNGLPLNPYGRTGLAGRGEYTCFGPNKVYFYVIFTKNKNKSLMLLTSKTTILSNDKNITIKYNLPSKWHHGVCRSYEFLIQILVLIGVSDTDTQMLTSRSHLEIGEVDSHLAHVTCQQILKPHIDTDNAWTEADVWAVDLSYLSDCNEILENYEWKTLDISYNYSNTKEENQNIRNSTLIANFLPENVQKFVDLSFKAFKLQ